MSFLKRIYSLIQRFADSRSNDEQSRHRLNSIQERLIQLAQVPFTMEALDQVVDLLFDKEQVVQETAQLTVHEIIQNKTCSGLVKLVNTGPRHWSEWYRLKPTDISKLTTNEQARTSMLGLLSMHSNGFVRQAAVQQLGLIEDGSEFPFLLLRLNDWVYVIREDAEPLVKARLCERYIPKIAANIDYICHSLLFKRFAHIKYVNLCIELLLLAQHQTALVAILRSADMQTRRTLLRLVFQSYADRALPLIDFGLECSDPLVRLWSIRQAAKQKSATEMQDILARKHRDPFMPVRRESYLIAAELYPSQAGTLWKQALTDSNPSICDYALFYLKKNGELDAASYLREQIAAHGSSPGMLNALGQVGDERDLPLIRHALSTGRVKVRVAAVRNLAKLGGETVRDELVHHIADPSSIVAGEARFQLIKLGRTVACDELFRAVETASFPHVIRIGFQLLQRQSKWDVLPWLIRLLSHSDQQIAMEAEKAITAWFTPPLCNKVYTRPSEGEREAIAQAMAQVSGGKEALLTQLKKWIDES